jgi:hypothetical protein
LKLDTVSAVEVCDWDHFVQDAYGRPYSFQQQEGCRGRGVHCLTVPSLEDDFENDTVPEVVNHSTRGVSFKAWLARDPEQPLRGAHVSAHGNERVEMFVVPGREAGDLELWWGRNFYPTIEAVANDLHEKGLIEAGEYIIKIDW